MITVEEFQKCLTKLLTPNEHGRRKIEPSTPVVIETENGKKYHLLTVKGRVHRAGHQHNTICWLLIGEKYQW